MDVELVRQRLADAVKAGVTLPDVDLQTFGYVPDQIDPPCFYTAEVEIDPNITMGKIDQFILRCRVLTSTQDDRAGQQMLDRLLRRKGPTSIRRVFHEAKGAPGQPALGGAADDLNVQKIDGYRLYKIGVDTFFGAEFRILIIGDGEEDTDA